MREIKKAKFEGVRKSKKIGQNKLPKIWNLFNGRRGLMLLIS